MKKKVSIMIIAAIVAFGMSCQKKIIDKFTEFDINYSANLSIPSSSITVTTPTTSVEFTTPNIPTQQSTKFSAEGTAKNLIDEIKMTKFDITATSTGTVTNLDYLKSITIYIKAAGVGEQVVASKTNVPLGISFLSLDLNDVNIKDYIFQDDIQFRVLVIFDSGSAADQTLKLDQTVHVSAKLLK